MLWLRLNKQQSFLDHFLQDHISLSATTKPTLISPLPGSFAPLHDPVMPGACHSGRPRVGNVRRVNSDGLVPFDTFPVRARKPTWEQTSVDSTGTRPDQPAGVSIAGYEAIQFIAYRPSSSDH